MVCPVLPALKGAGMADQKSAEAIVVGRKSDEGLNLPKSGQRTISLFGRIEASQEGVRLGEEPEVPMTGEVSSRPTGE